MKGTADNCESFKTRDSRYSYMRSLNAIRDHSTIALSSSSSF